MKINNKIISSLLAFLIVLGVGNVTLADTGNAKIDWLVEKEFVVGGGDGDLNLNGVLTREEAATIIVKALGKESIAPAYQGIESEFTDMSPKVWSNGMINVAVEQKIVNGFPDKTFGPKKNITYQEIIVMLVQVKGGLTAKERQAAPWPTPYIVKANDLGILEGVNTEKLTAEISRLKSFELLYNTVAKDLVEEDLDDYTVLVTEIERVHPIGKDEMGIKILKTLAGNKYPVDEYTRVKFNNINNPQDLLGKVLKVGLDEDNNLKKYEIDNSYEYLMGNVEFKKGKVVLNGETYDENDKLQFVYHNDKKISFDELVNKGKSNFARITLDKNDVIGIESFSFSQVDPIKEVNEKRITFVNGGFVNVDKAISIKDGVLIELDLSDLQAMDIGHVYGDNKILLSDEVELIGKLNDVVYNKDRDVVVEIDGKEFGVSATFHMLYSTNGKDFISLDSKKAYDDLYALRGQEVVYGIDLAGNLKYLITSKVTNEDFYIVDRLVLDEARFVDTRGNRVEFAIDLESNLLDVKGKRIEVRDLGSGDLVYITIDGNRIQKLVLVKDYMEIKKSFVQVKKDSQGNFALDNRIELNKDANVFLFQDTDNKLTKVTSPGVEEVLSNSKAESKLRVFTFSDYDFDNLGISKNVITSGEEHKINLVIFIGFEQTIDGAKEELVKLTDRFRKDYDKEIVGYVGEEEVTIKLAKDVKLGDMLAGDYLRVYLNAEDEIFEAEIIFKGSDKFVEVEDVNISSGKLIELTLKEGEKSNKYLVSKDLRELGTTVKGSLIKFHVNKTDEIDVILVK